MINIKKAEKEDALGIALVNVYTWKTQYSGIINEEILDLRIKNVEQQSLKIKERIIEDGQYFVAKYDGTVVGFVRYGKSEKENYYDYGEIHALYVYEGFRGKGIGKILFNAAKEKINEMGYNKFIICCLKENPSCNFYEHMGGVFDIEFYNNILGQDVVEKLFKYEY